MDQSLVGQSGQPFEMIIEAGKVKEFARAVGSSEPAFGGDAALTPPTFLMSAILWMGPENSAWQAYPISYERMLHGEQEFAFPGPPPVVGAHLTAVERIEKIYDKQGSRGGLLEFAEVVTEFHNESGALVATATCTYIQTSKTTTQG